jgi:hypothetical protein
MAWFSVNLGDKGRSFLADRKVKNLYYIICFHFHGQSQTADMLEEILQLSSPIWPDHNVYVTDHLVSAT